MMRYIGIIVTVLSFLFVNGCSAQQGRTKVLIKTTKGDIEIELYDETPQHRDNFVKLVNENFYDSLLFHRVIRDFMIQAGDPKSRGAAPDAMLGSGGPGYKVPAEILPQFFHKKGALSAARTSDRVNPKRESSGSQFYIVQGKVMKDQELDMMEKQANAKRNSAKIRKYLGQENCKPMRDEVIKFQQQRNGKALDSIAEVILDSLRAKGQLPPDFKFSEEQRNIYKTIGGTPQLDNQYTVFGEVTKGLEIVDAIADVETGRADRPVQDVIILSMEIVE